MPKIGLGFDVLEAATRRIAWMFDAFPKVCVSFSGGKDSTVMLHLVAAEARRRNRRFAVLFIDLEAQYKSTIDHVETCIDLHADIIDVFWVSLPLHLRNAVSVYEPFWLCWDPSRRADWVRNPPSRAITDESTFPFFRRGMEFEEFVPAFNEWYAGNQAAACVVGIRSDESLNRWRTIASRQKKCIDGRLWTTWSTKNSVNVYPIYDWKTEDIWTYHAQTGEPHNKLYDLMHRAGLTIHQMRICQPYGDDQRRGLWLFHLIEPETWARVVSRVNGANGGALYVRESGNIMGNLKITKPPGHSWESFSTLLLNSMPERTADHYRDKIAVFLNWWRERGCSPIPDENDPKQEAERKAPSWRRICKALLRNDYWCKGLSFTQQESGAYERYKAIMKGRRNRWGIY